MNPFARIFAPVFHHPVAIVPPMDLMNSRTLTEFPTAAPREYKGRGFSCYQPKTVYGRLIVDSPTPPSAYRRTAPKYTRRELRILRQLSGMVRPKKAEAEVRRMMFARTGLKTSA